jgi:hypothetical protein
MSTSGFGGDHLGYNAKGSNLHDRVNWRNPNLHPNHCMLSSTTLVYKLKFPQLYHARAPVQYFLFIGCYLVFSRF